MTLTTAPMEAVAQLYQKLLFGRSVRRPITFLSRPRNNYKVVFDR